MCGSGSEQWTETQYEALKNSGGLQIQEIILCRLDTTNIMTLFTQSSNTLSVNNKTETHFDSSTFISHKIKYWYETAGTKDKLNQSDSNQNWTKVRKTISTLDSQSKSHAASQSNLWPPGAPVTHCQKLPKKTRLTVTKWSVSGKCAREWTLSSAASLHETNRGGKMTQGNIRHYSLYLTAHLYLETYLNIPLALYKYCRRQINSIPSPRLPSHEGLIPTLTGAPLYLFLYRRTETFKFHVVWNAAFGS